MRLGERRVVPVTIVNEWRRERPVTVTLGDWTGCPGDPSVAVAGLVHPSGELTLGPCERRELVVEVIALPTKQTDVKPSSRTAERAAARDVAQPVDALGSVLVGRDRLHDVQVCATFCAELRVEGCSHRPVRFAVQVLPRSCDTYEIDCNCGCCC
jgi:hypothetical protein